MKIGVCCKFPGPCSTGDFIRRSAQASERHGFSSYWFGEHVVLFGKIESKYPYSGVASWAKGDEPPIPDVRATFPDPVIGMTWAAAATTTIEVGTSVLILPQRNPVVLAKELSYLDECSQGRVILGVGVGWCKEEMEAVGADFPNRGKLTDEYIEVMKVLWGDDAAEYKGRTVSFKDAYMYPRPVRKTGLPVLVGGDTDLAIKRAARLGDGWLPFSVKAKDAKERIAQYKKQVRENGRDPESMRIIQSMFSWTTLDELKMYRDAGVTEFLIFKSGELSVNDKELNEQLAETAQRFVESIKSW
jgi:probable F420-dependent oxidoreductase